MIRKLRKEKIDEKVIKKLINFVASVIEYQFIEKGKILFRQG